MLIIYASILKFTVAWAFILFLSAGVIWFCFAQPTAVFLNTSTRVKNFAMKNSRGRALRSEGWNRGDHRRLEYKLRVLCISMGNSSVSGHSSVPRDVRVHRRGGPGSPGAMTQDISRQALRFLCTPRQKKKKKNDQYWFTHPLTIWNCGRVRNVNDKE